MAQRFAREGFAALAPDLYRGEVAHEPDEAQKMMMALDMSRASRELTKAADYLASQGSYGTVASAPSASAWAAAWPSPLPATAPPSGGGALLRREP